MRIIILGAGEIGYHIALSLSRENREVTLVEGDAARADQVDGDDNDIQVIRGNGADPEVLLTAGLKSADLLVAVTNSDEANITACLLASRLAPAVRRVARIRNIDTRRHGRLLTGDPALIHAVINPEELCARKVFDLIRHPGTTDVEWFFDRSAALVSIPIFPDAPVRGWDMPRIGQERQARGLSFLVATRVRDGAARVPSAGDELLPGDTVYLATRADGLDDVLALFVPPERLKPLRNAAILGGGAMGLYLAEMLEQVRLNVKIIEPDARRAALLSDRLKTTLVLHGEADDPGVFEDERIGDSDVYAALTEDQENNLIAALYAKSLGVRLAVAALVKTHVQPLVQRMGVDAAVLPKQAAAGSILEHVRSGQVSSVIVMEQHGMEIFEAAVIAGSGLAGQIVRKQRMPRETLLLAVRREDGELVIPDGATRIVAGDRIAVIAHQRNIPRIETMLRGRIRGI